MTDLGRAPQTRGRGARFVIALGVGLLTTVVAAGALAQIGKSALIGKLEGPEVVTDAAQFPKTFKEAPQLAELVKAGKLPPVAERIGQDPLVIKPVQRDRQVRRRPGARGFTGPADFWNGFRCCSGPDHLMFWDYTGDKVVPNIAKGLEMQDGGRTWLVHLRRGMKWSDGKPFTADDFVFWFEDIYRNKDLVPTPSATMAINGKPGVIEKVDTYTVGSSSPSRTSCSPTCWPAPPISRGQMWAVPRHGRLRAGALPEAVPSRSTSARPSSTRRSRTRSSTTGCACSSTKNDWALNPDLPVLSPWKTATPINTPTWTLERNPYSSGWTPRATSCRTSTRSC